MFAEQFPAICSSLFLSGSFNPFHLPPRIFSSRSGSLLPKLFMFGKAPLCCRWHLFRASPALRSPRGGWELVPSPIFMCSLGSLWVPTNPGHPLSLGAKTLSRPCCQVSPTVPTQLGDFMCPKCTGKSPAAAGSLGRGDGAGGAPGAAPCQAGLGAGAAVPGLWARGGHRAPVPARGPASCGQPRALG